MEAANRIMLRAALLAGAACVTPGAAIAQEATQPAREGGAREEPPASATESADIVVTAQRRTERLQDVPVSVEVVSGDALVKRNMTSLEDVSRNVPSIRVVSTIGRSGALFIRGVGSGNSPAFDQSVATFIDGVYNGRARLAGNTFLDLERVEILKGPQSTFFGNNAIAGALNITTRQPSSTADGWARVLYGENGQYAVEGAVSGPITDTLSVRAALGVNGTDGWLRNVTTGASAPNQDNIVGRISLRYQPNEDFDATLKLEKSRNRNHSGFSARIADCPPPAPFNTPRGFCPQLISTNSPTGYDNLKYAANAGEHIDLDTSVGVLTTNYNMGGATLTSITSYSHYDYLVDLDTDRTPLTLQNASLPEQYGQFSQELRITSPTGGKIEYLAGVYYQSDWLNNDTEFSFTRLNGTISANPAFAALVPYLPLGQTIHFRQNERIYSAFGSLTWNVTKQLKLNVGLRASLVEKDFNWNLIYGTATKDYGGIVPLPAAIATLPQTLGTGIATSLASDRSDSQLMPSVQLQYAFTPNVRAYISYSRGFKAGGFNYGDVSGNLANFPFKPEKVDAFEAGLKSEWFNRALLFNVSLFRSKYKDLQTAVTQTNGAGAFVSLVSNAGASLSQGVELEMRVTPVKNLRFGATIAYLDSHYTDYPNASPTALQLLQLAQCLAVTPTPATACNVYRNQDLAGKPTQNAPRWSGSFNAEYTLQLPGEFELTPALNLTFASSQYYVPNADQTGRDWGFAKLDARVTLETPGRKWSFDLIANNLTNRLVFDYLAPYPGGALGSRQFFAQQPRNFAVQVRYRW